MCSIFNQIASGNTQLWIAVDKPEKGVSVQQQLHRMYSSKSGSGASKSSFIWIWHTFSQKPYNILVLPLLVSLAACINCHCGPKLMDHIKVAHLKPEFLDFAINYAKNDDIALADALPGCWNAQPSTHIGAPSSTPHDDLILGLDHLVDLPFWIGKGLMIPLQRALKLLVAALKSEVVGWVRHKIVAN